MRREADGSRVEFQCPPLLPACQAYMRGIDCGDQMIVFYNTGHCSKKISRQFYGNIAHVVLVKWSPQLEV